MIDGKKVVVVFPAYNAAKTLEKTYKELPFDIVDETVLVDDASKDDTAELAERIGINHVIIHDNNRGYGGNQKSCYNKAIELGADIAIMVHPDYQYTPLLVKSICSIIANDVFPVVYASRILGKGALKGGMPWYKYVANRILTLTQNILINQKLSEYHTGYRAFSTKVFDKIDIEKNSDDFVFDNQITAQIFYAGFEIGEVTCPTKYFDDASSINLKRSSIYGLGVLWVSLQYRLKKWGLGSAKIFDLKE
ncbi:MAG: glycosyltransferase family 2 protein [Bacteroidia bacterium]|nr:glycosyltransferase family 2 protein [Bacteroidia bacterium]NNJ55682.1 glycosyltransferase family 2 protein [Bacteroidia bacterium]